MRADSLTQQDDESLSDDSADQVSSSNSTVVLLRRLRSNLDDSSFADALQRNIQTAQPVDSGPNTPDDEAELTTNDELPSQESPAIRFA